MLTYALMRCCRVGVLGLALTFSVAERALAIQCDTITEYTEMWTGDESGSSFPLYGRGVAEGGGPGPCSITERTSITAPSGGELAAAIGTGNDHAESTVTVYIEVGSEDGNYTTTAVAWSQGVYYGCGTQVAALSGYVARYFFLGQNNDGTYAYARSSCFHKCQKPAVDTSEYVGEYARSEGKYVNLFFGWVCHGWISGQPTQPPCYGPPE